MKSPICVDVITNESKRIFVFLIENEISKLEKLMEFLGVSDRLIIRGKALS